MFHLPNIENMLARSVDDSVNDSSCGFKSHDMATFYTHELHVVVYAERGFRVIPRIRGFNFVLFFQS